METKETYNQLDTWAIVEIMGHQRYAGRITEQTIAGSSFLRVDVPAFKDKAAFTKLFSPASVYAITPVTEGIAKGVAEQLGQQPIQIWDLPESMQEKLRAPRNRLGSSIGFGSVPAVSPYRHDHVDDGEDADFDDGFDPDDEAR